MNPDRSARHAAWTNDLDGDSSNEDSADDDEVLDLFMDLVKSTDDDSDLSESGLPAKRGGSMPGKLANVDRFRRHGHDRLFADYFAQDKTQSTTNPTSGDDFACRKEKLFI
jgi:hypothetical protein